MKNLKTLSLACMAMIAISCNNSENKVVDNDKKPTVNMPKIHEQVVDYKSGNASMHSFVAYDENKEGRRPAVLVVHEWWGLNDYIKMRARELAKLGYIAIAVDMYGDSRTGNNPEEATKLSTPFYSDTKLAQARFDAAWAQLKTFAQTDTTKTAAIGYCFGGAMALNMARLGEDLDGVVSFHGGLASSLPADKAKLKAKILVCHGEADSFVQAPEVATFKKQMDSIQADYTFKSYPGATHAFSNPQATELGEKFKMPIAYNAAADTASWNEMKVFFERIFR